MAVVLARARRRRDRRALRRDGRVGRRRRPVGARPHRGRQALHRRRRRQGHARARAAGRRVRRAGRRRCRAAASATPAARSTSSRRSLATASRPRSREFVRAGRATSAARWSAQTPSSCPPTADLRAARRHRRPCESLPLIATWMMSKKLASGARRAGARREGRRRRLHAGRRGGARAGAADVRPRHARRPAGGLRDHAHGRAARQRRRQRARGGRGVRRAARHGAGRRHRGRAHLGRAAAGAGRPGAARGRAASACARRSLGRGALAQARAVDRGAGRRPAGGRRALGRHGARARRRRRGGTAGRPRAGRRRARHRRRGVRLGAGRSRAGDPVDHAVGIVLDARPGDRSRQARARDHPCARRRHGRRGGGRRGGGVHDRRHRGRAFPTCCSKPSPERPRSGRRGDDRSSPGPLQDGRCAVRFSLLARPLGRRRPVRGRTARSPAPRRSRRSDIDGRASSAWSSPSAPSRW